MASSIPILSEDQLLCSICLDVFTDPVSTPCGHNFCKSCLAGHWDKSYHCKCPLCNKIFENRPDLSVNTFISETAAHFIKTAEIKARRAHKHTPNLKKHTLIDPVENQEDYVCQKHEKPLELFCRDDQTCVCLLCTVTDHKTHSIIPVGEASGERKAQIKKTQTEVQKMIQNILQKTKKIKKSLELKKKGIEDETAGSVEVFTALMRSIERSQAELLEVTEKKQKAAERQAEELIKDLEQEITELKRRDTELEQLSHTEDHLHLLQVYPSQFSRPQAKNWTDISLTTHSSMDILGPSFSQLQKTLNKEFEKELQKRKLRSLKKTGSKVIYWFMKNWRMILSLLPFLAFIFIFLMPGRMWTSVYAVMASSCFILSEDQFLCCVCLRMFTDPVSTPCGHNFCKSCLNVYWDNSNRCKCPMCNKIFENRPDLSVNTLISELEAQFEKSTEVNSRRDREHEDKTCCEKLDVCLQLLIKLEKRSQQKAEAANWFMGKWLILLFLFSLAFIFLTSDTMWMSFYAVDVTLDPDTAHPSLILSDDGKQVRDGVTYQNLPDNSERFDECVCVLGKEGFSSGRFYYEVQVSGKTDWDLGVARESVNRKGINTLTPQNGFWTVGLRNGNQYKAFAGPPVSLFLREKLQKVSVFVDYEEGLVSFYDVEARSHIYSFTGQSFTEKLYPYFSPGLNEGGINSAPLIISNEFKSTVTKYLRIFITALL